MTVIVLDHNVDGTMVLVVPLDYGLRALAVLTVFSSQARYSVICNSHSTSVDLFIAS